MDFYVRRKFTTIVPYPYPEETYAQRLKEECEMNAKEASELSKASAMDEIAQIEEKIKEACKFGYTSIRSERLKEATIQWLTENGYEYKAIQTISGWNSGFYKISW